METTKHKHLDYWMDTVDITVQYFADVSLWDLPDVPLADWFEQGFTPYEAATAALEYAGY